MNNCFLFVTGCPRSGTSVLARVLNAHPQIAIGMERFNNRIARRSLKPSDFERRRFFEFQDGDTWYKSAEAFSDWYSQLADKYDVATYHGDKFPGAYAHYAYLADHFSDVCFIFILRNIFDVAISFEARRANGQNWPADGGAEYAVSRWNAAIAFTLKWREQARILVLSYEDIFVRDGSIYPISNFLGLDPQPMEAAVHRERQRQGRSSAQPQRLTPEQAEHICKHANFGGYRLLLGLNPGGLPDRRNAESLPATAPISA